MEINLSVNANSSYPPLFLSCSFDEFIIFTLVRKSYDTSAMQHDV
jgi:hypothetical protein